MQSDTQIGLNVSSGLDSQIMMKNLDELNNGQGDIIANSYYFDEKKVSEKDELEEKFNQVSPLLSNAKSETAKFYNENPGSYAIAYSTDIIDSYVDNIIELLKQSEE